MAKGWVTIVTYPLSQGKTKTKRYLFLTRQSARDFIKRSKERTKLTGIRPSKYKIEKVD